MIVPVNVNIDVVYMFSLTIDFFRGEYETF